MRRSTSTIMFIDEKPINTITSFDELRETEDISESIDLSIKDSGSFEIQMKSESVKPFNQLVNRSIIGWS